MYIYIQFELVFLKSGHELSICTCKYIYAFVSIYTHMCIAANTLLKFSHELSLFIYICNIHRYAKIRPACIYGFVFTYTYIYIYVCVYGSTSSSLKSAQTRSAILSRTRPMYIYVYSYLHIYTKRYVYGSTNCFYNLLTNSACMQIRVWKIHIYWRICMATQTCFGNLLTNSAFQSTYESAT